MSISILYHGWKVIKFRHRYILYKGGCIFFEIEPKSLLRCPDWGDPRGSSGREHFSGF